MALPEVLLDIGFNGPTTGDFFTIGDPIRGQVGVKQIGTGDIWVTIAAARIKSWHVRYGATNGDAPTLRYDAATADIVLHDPEREFDPENLDGPYVSAGVSQVEAMVRVRLRAVWDSTSYPLFYGYADDFEPDYQGNEWTYVTLTATDPTKVFAAFDRGASVSAGAGEDSGARVTRILDAAGWPDDDRLIAVGDTTLQATTLDGNALSELQLVQDTELGQFYFDRTGRAVFWNRHAINTETRSNTSQAEFGDGGYTATSEIPYADVKPSKRDDSLVNQLSITRAGGAEQNVEDSGSIARYLTHSYQRSDLLMETDAVALLWANFVLFQFSAPSYRFASLDFNTPSPQLEAVFWPAVLGREIGDRITVTRRPKGGGDPIVKDCLVRGIDFASDGAAWTTSFVLQNAGRYAFFVIGDPFFGRVGFNAIGY